MHQHHQFRFWQYPAQQHSQRWNTVQLVSFWMKQDVKVVAFVDDDLLLLQRRTKFEYIGKEEIQVEIDMVEYRDQPGSGNEFIRFAGIMIVVVPFFQGRQYPGTPVISLGAHAIFQAQLFKQIGGSGLSRSIRTEECDESAHFFHCPVAFFDIRSR